MVILSVVLVSGIALCLLVLLLLREQRTSERVWCPRYHTRAQVELSGPPAHPVVRRCSLRAAGERCGDACLPLRSAAGAHGG